MNGRSAKTGLWLSQFQQLSNARRGNVLVNESGAIAAAIFSVEPEIPAVRCEFPHQEPRCRERLSWDVEVVGPTELESVTSTVSR